MKICEQNKKQVITNPLKAGNVYKFRNQSTNSGYYLCVMTYYPDSKDGSFKASFPKAKRMVNITNGEMWSRNDSLPEDFVDITDAVCFKILE